MADWTAVQWADCLVGSKAAMKAAMKAVMKADHLAANSVVLTAWNSAAPMVGRMAVKTAESLVATKAATKAGMKAETKAGR